MADKRFGVALFADEQDPKEAWAAVNGSQAKKIQHVGELSTDTIWWTNLSYEAFFRKTQLGRNPYLRHDAYLVCKPADVLREWGYDPDVSRTGSDFQASFISTVFSRIMRIAFRLVKDVEPNAKMDHVFTGNTLREDLRRLLPPAEYPKGEAAQILKTGQAWQEFTRTTARPIRGAKLVMLRRPRLPYAIQMMQTPVPKGPFEFLGRSDLRQLTSDRTNWMCNSSDPCLAEIAIMTIDADIGAVFGFGNSTDKDRRIARSWVAHPEALALAEVADIDVKNVYVGKGGYGLMTNEMHEGVRRFLSDRYAENSWSAGVIAETLWRAAALGEEKTRSGSTPPEERPHTSWRGAWIKANDKACMFGLAMRLTRMGYSISSYGFGWLTCMCPEESIPELMRDALSLGMLPKLVDVPESLYSTKDPIPWDGDKKSMGWAQMLMSRQNGLLWDLDQLPLYDPSQRDAMLQKIIQKHRQKAA